MQRNKLPLVVTKFELESKMVMAWLPEPILDEKVFNEQIVGSYIHLETVITDNTMFEITKIIERQV